MPKMDRGGCLNTRPARIHRGGCLNTRSARIHRGGCLNSEVSLNTQNGPWGLFKHACGHQIAASCSKVLKTERFRYDSVMVSGGCQFLEIAEIGKPFNETKMDRGGCLNTRPARIHRGGCLNTRSARIHRGGFASRCGLAYFLQKVSFFLRFKLGLLGIRLLAAVLQWSIRRTTIFIDSFGPRFTSFFTASQSILFYSTFRARSSKTP
jgi:hypothetical protein